MYGLFIISNNLDKLSVFWGGRINSSWLLHSIARTIWPSLIHTPQIFHTVTPDKTPHHWWPMLNCPFNSNLDFTQSCLIQTHTQIALHWHPMLNCPFNSNPIFAQSHWILFSPILHIYNYWKGSSWQLECVFRYIRYVSFSLIISIETCKEV